MRNSYYTWVALLWMLLGTGLLSAQPSSGGLPLSQSPAFQLNYEPTERLPATLLPTFPLEKVLKEDEAYPGVRVAAPIRVDLGLDNAGVWTELPSGDRLWRLKIRSKGALALSALYDELYLPPGATLFMYRTDGAQMLGAYTHDSNTPNSTFMTGFIAGETAVIEYFEPKAVRGQGLLHIFRIDHAYRKEALGEKSVLNESGFGASVACNVNVNCPQGMSWQKQKRGICRIIVVVEEGTGFCTGNLINNTAQDGKPYILSAFHCQDGFTPKYDFWRYDFNFESPSCNNPPAEPTYQSMLGSTLRASRRQNDFLLLELKDTIPNNYNVYYNGWDRRSQPPATAFSIHHPKGDIKKIAFENQAATIYGPSYQWSTGNGQVLYTSPANHLIRIQFDASTVEVGSSGAALFDGNGRIVGQLHGGNDLGSCTLNSVFYDRLTLAWEGGGSAPSRLKDWLDPTGSNLGSLDGMEKGSDGAGTVAGFVRTGTGEGIAGVTVTLDGPSAFKISTVTDTNGAYKFRNLSPSASYSLSLAKDLEDQNGVNVLDVVKISRHILNTELLDSPVKILAADVNDSQSVSVLDVISIRKLILGLDTEFEEMPSWQFIPANFEFFNPENPWENFISKQFSVPKLDNAVLNFDFTGYKTGDVDFSANPKN